MNIHTGIRAALAVMVMVLLIACNGAGDAATPDAGARGHAEPPPSIATTIAQAETAVSDALSDAGIAYSPCGRMCSENFWRTATPADVQVELDRGAAVDARDWLGLTPLHLAVRYGKWSAVAALLDGGADVDVANEYNGVTPLVYALSETGRFTALTLDTIALLLERGADPNALNKGWGGTPLHITADPVVAALLIAHGADVNARNRDGETPLHSTYSFEIAALLLSSGADVNAQNADGETPLLATARSEFATLFLDNGADVTINSTSGWTPLHQAAYSIRDAEVVKELLELGVAVNAQNKRGESACDWVKVAIQDRDPSDSASDIAEIDEIRDLVCP